MKILALFLCVISLLLSQEREGNFVIRFEPQAVLQSNIEIPFEIHVQDDRRRPLEQAKVTLQIETPQHTQVKIYHAPSVGAGEYIAKPVFPSAGEWNVYVEVRQNGEVSARTIEYSIPETAAP